MSKVCLITGKSSKVVGGYSNAVRATKYNPIGKRRVHANLQKRKLFIPELGQSVRVTISARGMRTLKKRGVSETLRKIGAL